MEPVRISIRERSNNTCSVTPIGPSSSSESTSFVGLRSSSSSGISALKIKAAEPFSKMKAWVDNKVENPYKQKVDWTNDKGQLINIKISDLAKKLGIAPEVILEYSKNGILQELKFEKRVKLTDNATITLSELAKQLGISKTIVLKYYQSGSISQLSDKVLLKNIKQKESHLKELSRELNLQEPDLLKFYDNILITSPSSNKWEYDAKLQNYLMENTKEVVWKGDGIDKGLIKIEELASRLGITKDKILEYVKVGKLKFLNELEGRTSSLNLNFSKTLNSIENAKKLNLEEGILNTEKLYTIKTKNLENLSIELNISYKDLLKHIDQLSIDEKGLITYNSDFEKYLSVTTKKVRWVDSNNKVTNINIPDLAKKLGITDKRVMDYVKKGDLQALQKLEYRMKDLKSQDSFLKVLDLVESGKFEEYHLHQQAEKIAQEDVALTNQVDENCVEIFKNLDLLYRKNAYGDTGSNLLLPEGSHITTQTEEGFNSPMTLKELNTLKLIIRSTLLVFKKIPPRTDQIMSDWSEKHRILVEQSGESIRITGLFGIKLGAGAAGVAIRPINILTGKLAEGEDAVLKKPIGSDEEIISESNLLKKIHSEQEILGIQKPVRVIKDVFNGREAHSHFGPRYETDLQDILEPKVIAGEVSKIRELSTEDGVSIAYQLLHGVSHLHKQSITHGDIKPGNIFCNYNTSTEPQGETVPILYIGDFGESIDHTEKDSVKKITRGTPVYRPARDTELALVASQTEDINFHLKIEKDVDVFASCSVICSLFTKEEPYDGMPDTMEKPFTLKVDLKAKLISAGLSEKAADILIRGLSHVSNERPEAQEILSAIQDELSTIAPERKEFLLRLSKPL